MPVCLVKCLLTLYETGSQACAIMYAHICWQGRYQVLRGVASRQQAAAALTVSGSPLQRVDGAFAFILSRDSPLTKQTPEYL